MIAWNEFLFAFMFLDNLDMFTLSLGGSVAEFVRGAASASNGWCCGGHRTCTGHFPVVSKNI